MYIIYYLLSIGSLLTAIFANISTGAAVTLVLLALLFLLIGTWLLLSARLASRRRSERQIISPEELRHFRELAEKNKADKNAGSE
jgi:uncharacterized membrane protein